MSAILLIEDNEMNRDMLSRRLKRKGYDVMEAADAEEGLEMARTHTIDLVLMDVSLPGMDGWEATAQLKKTSQTSHLPIIILTAHARTEDRVKSIQLGCDDFATKPIDFPLLLGKIEQQLNR